MYVRLVRRLGWVKESLVVSSEELYGKEHFWSGQMFRTSVQYSTTSTLVQFTPRRQDLLSKLT